MTKHLIMPDCQVKPGDPIEHLTWAGRYAVKHKPDVIINIGDFWDMPSLSSYDKGKKSFEGRRYTKDIKAGRKAMETFMQPIWDEQDRQRKAKEKIWKPRLVYCIGNHEERILRATEEASEFDGLISFDDLDLEWYGYEVYPFLEPALIDGIAYCHYFTSGVMGRPVTNAKLLINKKMMSCVQGHVQDRDIAYGRKADGSSVTGLFCGIFYQHDESYLNPQTNKSWRGIWMLNQVEDGSFDELPISMSYLKRKYGKGTKRLRV